MPEEFYGPSEIHPVLSTVTSNWQRQLERGNRYKQETFGRYARECQSFFLGPKSWDEMMGSQYMGPGDRMPDLSFKMHINKAYEYVTIFGPSLYYNNPVRSVKPRAPVQVPGQFFADPMQFQQLALAEQQRVAFDGIRAILLEAYLNQTPSRYHLDIESRQAVDEALVKGMGLLWTELVEPPSGEYRAVTSRFDSVDHLLIDPDARSFKDAKWISRRCVQPTWQVERDYGLRPGSLKGNLESMAIQADLTVDPDMSDRRARGITGDLVVFHQIWSKMGMGRTVGSNYNMRKPLDDIFGDYVYLVVCNSARFPLNLPPDLVNDENRTEDMLRAAQWPIPFYEISEESNGGWPCTPLDWHKVPDSPWPFAPLLAARGEMRFLNWAYSFLACHLRNASRDFVAVQKSLDEEIKSTIIEGRDLTLIELEHENGAITDCIAFLQHPEVNGDIWTYLDAVNKSFDKRVGLNEIMYGDKPDTQPRSAAESNIKNQMAGIRPDDMGQQVEEWQSEVATKEAFCARYLLQGSDISLWLGPLAAQAWDQYVFTTNTTEAFHALEYRIEAGSTRKPNKEFQVNQMTDAMQVLLPVFQAYAQQTQDLQPLNNLVSDYCKSRDLDPNRYQMTVAPPAPMLPTAAPSSPTQGEGGVEVSPASGQQQLG